MEYGYGFCICCKWLVIACEKLILFDFWLDSHSVKHYTHKPFRTKYRHRHSNISIRCTFTRHLSTRIIHWEMFMLTQIVSQSISKWIFFEAYDIQGVLIMFSVNKVPLKLKIVVVIINIHLMAYFCFWDSIIAKYSYQIFNSISFCHSIDMSTKFQHLINWFGLSRKFK